MKGKFLIFLICLVLGIWYLVFLSSGSFAQTPTCGSGTPARAQGLVTTPTLSGKFSSTGACITDPKTAFLPFKIPTYEDLKSLYFTQAKGSSAITKHATLSGDHTENDIPLTGQADHLYQISGNLTISGNISGNQSGVIFVDKNLTIAPQNNQLTHGTATSGLVFVVKGNVNIAQSVTQIDAVIIAEGKIYTAGANCSQAAPVSASQLIVNGSLISLSDSNKIEFCRTLSDNSQPAEKIVHQVKYLVILRNLYSDTLQKWSEIP